MSVLSNTYSNPSCNWEACAREMGFVTTSFSGDTARHWYDLEQFVVDGVRFSSVDSRLFTSYAIFVKTFLDILSPAKLKRVAIASRLNNKEKKFLGFVLEFGSNASMYKNQWKKLIEFIRAEIKNSEEEKAFSSFPFKSDEKLKKWKLLGSKLELDKENKYLNTSKAIKAPQIFRRLEGRKTVAADIVAYREIAGKERNLSELAREINQDYSTVYKVDKILKMQEHIR